MIKGINKSIQNMRKRSQAFKGTSGNIYPSLSAIMKSEIEKNADKSYNKSPAKTKAIQSADNWQHATMLHNLKIMTLFYANYRQYGCGGLPITILVAVSQQGENAMAEIFSKAFHQR